MAQQLYPLFLDLAGRRILVVGAGAVAARKVRGVLDAGATSVRVVAPEFAEAMPEGVQRVCREFVEGDLEDIDICFAATGNREVNSRVVQLCHVSGILVNRADRDERWPGSFAVPAVHRAGPITVAVSASGSPRLALAIRDEVARKLDENWAAMGETVLEMRERIIGLTDLPQARRAQMLRSLFAPDAVAAYKACGRDGLEKHMTEHFPELKA